MFEKLVYHMKQSKMTETLKRGHNHILQQYAVKDYKIKNKNNNKRTSYLHTVNSTFTEIQNAYDIFPKLVGLFEHYTLGYFPSTIGNIVGICKT